VEILNYLANSTAIDAADAIDATHQGRRAIFKET